MGVVHIPGFYEPVASWMHLLTAVLILVFGVNLVRDGIERRERFCLGVYVLGSAGLFALSGTFHLLSPDGAARAVLQRLDHAFIWVMIAGTFTALHGVAFRGPWRWGFLAVVWSLAITGIVLKTVFFASMPEWLGLCLYLTLGWMGVISMIKIGRHHGREFARLVVLAGMVYSVGAAYDFGRGPALIPGVLEAHEVFHLAVVGGAAVYWRLVRKLMGGEATPLFSRRRAKRPAIAPSPQPLPAAC